MDIFFHSKVWKCGIWSNPRNQRCAALTFFFLLFSPELEEDTKTFSKERDELIVLYWHHWKALLEFNLSQKLI